MAQQPAAPAPAAGISISAYTTADTTANYVRGRKFGTVKKPSSEHPCGRKWMKKRKNSSGQHTGEWRRMKAPVAKQNKEQQLLSVITITCTIIHFTNRCRLLSTLTIYPQPAAQGLLSSSTTPWQRSSSYRTKGITGTFKTSQWAMRTYHESPSGKTWMPSRRSRSRFSGATLSKSPSNLFSYQMWMRL